ncbi:hypothetical protein OROMI_012501 [Orobanche minor]
MRGATKERNRTKLRKVDDERTLQSLKQELKPHKGHSSLFKGKISKCATKGNVNVNLKRKKIVNKAIAHKTKTSKKRQSLSVTKHKPSTITAKENEKTYDRDVKRRRRRKKRKNSVELDEASRLERRTRYLLVKIKLEQNFVDAYSTEGWKGQSREKIKPEKELQRAKKQILMYKVGIREALHQLDLLSSEGRINDSAVASDGSIHHDHIVCAKCKLREAFPDDDIILCDGTCNRAFHQKCLDPPLSTDNIPPGDEGWFCKFCKKKMEILEVTNAHLGSHFPMDCNWQGGSKMGPDVFKEEANLPDDGNTMLCLEEEWPSDDSQDDDYDPDSIGPCGSDSMSRSESGAYDYSSSFLGSLEDETGIREDRTSRSFNNNSLDLIGVDSDDGEVVCRSRQRAAVDYIKLYDEMFGKNATENERISDDEDWGPRKRKRKVKETDNASTLMTLVETAKTISEDTPSEIRGKELTNKTKKPIFRLPHNAVEKLRLVFSENELPARSLRASLSKQLGLEFEKDVIGPSRVEHGQARARLQNAKLELGSSSTDLYLFKLKLDSFGNSVNKWFKNARYLALKARKKVVGEKAQEYVSPVIQEEPRSETAKGELSDQMELNNNMTVDSPEMILKTFVSTRKTRLRKNQMTVDLGDDVSLKHLREKAKQDEKKRNCENRDCLLEAETEMERLCEIKSRVERLQQSLLQLPGRRFGKSSAIKSNDPSVIFVPVAELREKR